MERNQMGTLASPNVPPLLDLPGFHRDGLGGSSIGALHSVLLRIRHGVDALKG